MTVDAQPLLSDGHIAALASALGAGLLAIAGAIRWGVGRLVKSIDDVGSDNKLLRVEVAEMKAVVNEGRNDIAEIRGAVTGLVFEPPAVDKPRRQTNPSLRPLRRAVTATEET